MHLTFKETKEEVYAAQRVSKHVSPHLHNALEIVCVTETLRCGTGFFDWTYGKAVISESQYHGRWI